MKLFVLSCLLFALFGFAFSEEDELLSREKRQNRRFGGNRGGYNNNYGHNNGYNNGYNNRPFQGPGFGRPGRPSRPNFNRPNHNRPNFNRPNYGNNNNNNGQGLSINLPLGNPGAPINNQLPPHNPAILGLFGALLNQGNRPNNHYGRPTQSPFIGFQLNGPNGRPALTYADQNTQIHIRNRPKKP